MRLSSSVELLCSASPRSSPASLESCARSILGSVFVSNLMESSPRRSASMFSQHPFTLGHRYSLDAAHALPTWKRLLDLMCCIAALPLLGLVTFVFMLLAKLSSGGPVFYRQQHAGCLGRSF